jgi:sulfate transport system ATP-binding protein
VKQVGSPDELYERPASDFVMSFLGPVTRIGGELVRPHDIELFAEPAPKAQEARVTRVTRLGFEVRVDLEVDGEDAWAQATRGTAQALDLKPDDRIYIRPHRSRTSVTVLPGGISSAS